MTSPHSCLEGFDEGAVDDAAMDEEPIEAICQDTGLNADAVYAQKSRLLKLARKVAADIESGAVPS